jgi:segregation and condensation protein B
VEPVRIVEAVLFSASKPVKVSEIETQTRFSPEIVRKALKKLKEEYDAWGSSIELIKTGSGYSLVIREEFSDFGRVFAPKEVPDDVLRTAAMIAYHQPVLQSDLARTLGSRVYEDVKVLQETGIITARKKGQTLLLTTNKRFSEYFGIEGTSQAALKKWMEERAKEGPKV